MVDRVSKLEKKNIKCDLNEPRNSKFSRQKSEKKGKTSREIFEEYLKISLGKDTSINNASKRNQIKTEYLQGDIKRYNEPGQIIDIER